MGGKTRKSKGKRNRSRSRRFSLIFPYVLVLAIFFFGFGERLWEVAEIKGSIREREISLREVGLRKDELEAEKALATDPAALHEKIRRLGYIYPGETVYLGAD